MSAPGAPLTGLSRSSATLGLTRSMTHAWRAQGFDLAAALFGAADAAFERLPSQAQALLLQGLILDFTDNDPQLALRVEGEWRRIYELLSLERLAGELQDPVVWAGQVFDMNKRRQAAIDGLRTRLKDLSTGGALPPELF